MGKQLRIVEEIDGKHGMSGMQQTSLNCTHETNELSNEVNI